MNKKHRGAASELAVCQYLLSQGYEVFRNISQHGLIDLIAYNPDTRELRFIDVKTASLYITKDGDEHLGKTSASPEQIEHGVEILGVHPNTMAVIAPETVTEAVKD